MVEAMENPLRAREAPLPPAVGVTVPEMEAVDPPLPPPPEDEDPYADIGQVGQEEPLDQVAGKEERFLCELLTLVQPEPLRKRRVPPVPNKAIQYRVPAVTVTGGTERRFHAAEVMVLVLALVKRVPGRPAESAYKARKSDVAVVELST